MPGNDGRKVWLVSGLRTPFVAVDGPFAERDSLRLSVPVVQAMAQQANGRIDFGVWGTVVLNLAYANLARDRLALTANALAPEDPAERAWAAVQNTTDQAALEGYQGHGVFTYALLDALVNGDTNNDGKIELSELTALVEVYQALGGGWQT